MGLEFTSWLNGQTVGDFTVQQARDKEVDTIISMIHLHSNNTSVCSVLGESQSSLRVCVLV